MNKIFKIWLIAILTLVFSILCFIAFSQTYKQNAKKAILNQNTNVYIQIN